MWYPKGLAVNLTDDEHIFNGITLTPQKVVVAIKVCVNLRQDARQAMENLGAYDSATYVADQFPTIDEDPREYDVFLCGGDNYVYPGEWMAKFGNKNGIPPANPRHVIEICRTFPELYSRIVLELGLLRWLISPIKCRAFNGPAFFGCKHVFGDWSCKVVLFKEDVERSWAVCFARPSNPRRDILRVASTEV